jgi:hypothetical protein
MKVIQSVGTILECYDSDKMIPLLGFGANIPGIPKVVNCFAMNGNIFNPEVVGVKGALETYSKCINKIKLSGPTYFAPIIKYVCSIANFYASAGMYLLKQAKLFCFSADN